MGPSPYPKRGLAPPDFRPTFVVAKRLHGLRCSLSLSSDNAHNLTITSTGIIVHGTEVGLGLRGIVFDVDPATTPSRKENASTLPNFGPCLLCANGWMDEDAA